jgi:hypothetical protein
MADTEGYDQAIVTDEHGKVTTMNKQTFKALPLGQRIGLILAKKVEFRLRGQVVPSHIALGAGG